MKTKRIYEIIKENSPTEKNLYHLSTSTQHYHGDESSIETMIFEFWGNHDREEDMEADEKITQELWTLTPNDLCNSNFEHNPKLIETNGLLKIWINEWNDILQIQITDHHIIFTHTQSGQY